jgi:DNA segregation ATPase FtsK/SpoIIIE, S-DNA-T family
MPDVRALLVAGVRDRIASARGLARAELSRAQAAARGAESLLAQARRSAAQARSRAAGERDARLAEADTAHAGAVADLVAAARRAAAAEAPEAASASWSGWQPRPVERAEAAPLLRIGEVEVGGGRPVPALVPLLDRGHVVLAGTDLAAVDNVLATLLLRALGGARPGSVRILGYDPERLGGSLAGFAPLAGAGLLTFVGPRGLSDLLDGLVEEVRRINEKVLAGEYSTLRELAERTGRRPEPWRLAVLLGDGGELSRHERAQLARVVRTGAACGVHVIARGMPIAADTAVAAVTTITVDAAHARVSRYPELDVLLDGPPPADLVTKQCRTFAERIGVAAVFDDLLPAQMWTRSSGAALVAPVGESAEGRLVEVTLGDHPPHALIGGPTGSGKTNFIYAWLGALTSRYSPDELELYLLDFKEGVSFARFAPGQRDPSWLPHVRLVGVNVNTDREFGLALLRFLRGELRRRAEAAKRYEVTKLAELRAEDPDGRWPRILAVVDEFQVLVSGRDALATEAVTLLEDLARRGRSQGIHLVLASQDVSGIEALWGRSALVAQFTLRVALPKARRILAETNPAAEQIARHHAVVNADSGVPEANRIVRVPEAGDRDVWGKLQHGLWQLRPADLPPPRLFDGDAVPQLGDAADFGALAARPAYPGQPDARSAVVPVALLGEAVDVTARSARLTLSRAPGRNLAVIGSRVDEACAVLGAAGRSLARQYRPGTARFSVACLDPDALAAARALYDALPAGSGWYDPDGVPELLADTAAELAGAPGTPHFLLMYAVDAAASRLSVKAAGGSGHEHLRRILATGPERHTHVLGWWRGVPRLRDDLGGIGARFDAIGAWVALDVHGGELAPLSPQPGGPAWYPRPWRALFFDRAVHRTAEVIIPYGLSR